MASNGRALIVPAGPEKEWRRSFTRYDPEFCEVICDLAQQGKFPEQWCAFIGCAMSSLYRWANEHEEFDRAVHMAWHLLEAYWTDYAHKNLKNKDLRTTLMIEMLRKRFPSTWGQSPINTYENFKMRDRNETADNENDDGESALEDLTLDQLNERIETLLKRRSAAG